MTTTQDTFQPIDQAAAAQMDQAEAIQFHYDNDTRFFSLWLDETLSYSAARWSDPLTGAALSDTLSGAQREKIRHHLAAARVKAGAEVLDVGCGWGAVIRSAVADFGAKRALGLTLSTHQYEHIKANNRPGVDVLLQDMFKWETEARFDAAVSIGAFEHFAKPEMDRAEKVETYRAFFEALAALMPGRGARFSLQTIVWDKVTFDKSKMSIPETVFPQSDLPFIDEIAQGSNGPFRMVFLENDPNQYSRTLSAWIDGLTAHRGTIEMDWGAEKYKWFRRYLRQSRLAFQSRMCSLSRIVLERR